MTAIVTTGSDRDVIVSPLAWANLVTAVGLEMTSRTAPATIDDEVVIVVVMVYELLAWRRRPAPERLT